MGVVENVGPLSKNLLMTSGRNGGTLARNSAMLDEVTSDKSLPANLEAERSVLGAVLLDPTSLNFVVPILDADDFFPDNHRRIYSAMRELAERSTEIDLLTLKEELDRAGAIEKIGGPAYLSALLDGVPDRQDNGGHGNSFRSQDRVLGTSVHGEFPFFYSCRLPPCS